MVITPKHQPSRDQHCANTSQVALPYITKLLGMLGVSLSQNQVIHHEIPAHVPPKYFNKAQPTSVHILQKR